jgi:hypothetical protein
MKILTVVSVVVLVGAAALYAVQLFRYARAIHDF